MVNSEEFKKDKKPKSIFDHVFFRKYYRRFDYFGYLPTPRHIGYKKKFSTTRSNIISMFILVVFSAFALTNFISWRTASPNQIQQLDLPANDFTLNAKLFGVSVVYKGGPIEDPSIFRFEFVNIIQHVGKNPSYEEVDLGVKKCSVGTYKTDSPYFNFYCPEREGTINAGIATDLVQTVQLRIKLCLPSTNKDPNITCKGQSDLNDFIRNSRVTMFFGETIYDPAKSAFTTNWVFYFGYMYQELQASWDMIIRRYIVEERADLFTSFSAKQFTGIKINYYDATAKTLFKGNPDIYLINVYLDTSQLREIYYRKTTIEVFGQTGAFFNATVLILGLYMWHYNRNRFYLENTAWDNLGDDAIDKLKEQEREILEDEEAESGAHGPATESDTNSAHTSRQVSRVRQKAMRRTDTVSVSEHGNRRLRNLEYNRNTLVKPMSPEKVEIETNAVFFFKATIDG